jgi:hypothetical protein
MGYWEKQPSSKLGRSIVTQIATAQTNATQFTTPFASQTIKCASQARLPSGSPSAQRPLSLRTAPRHSYRPTCPSISPSRQDRY